MQICIYIIVELKVPVLAYGVVITLMLTAAITRAYSYHLGISNKSKLYAAVGAVLFVCSDTILALDKFTSPIAHGKFYVMVTYYLGQTFIGASAWPSVSNACPFCSGVVECRCSDEANEDGAKCNAKCN